MKKQSETSAVFLTVPSGGVARNTPVLRRIARLVALVLVCGLVPLARDAHADAAHGHAHLVTQAGAYSPIARLGYNFRPSFNCNCPRQQIRFEALVNFPGVGTLILKAAPSDLLTRAACPEFVKVEGLLDNRTLFVGTLVKQGETHHGLLTKQFGPANHQHVQVWDVKFLESNSCS